MIGPNFSLCEGGKAPSSRQGKGAFISAETQNRRSARPGLSSVRAAVSNLTVLKSGRSGGDQPGLARGVLSLKIIDRAGFFHRQTDVVQAVHQAVLAESVDFKRDLAAIRLEQVKTKDELAQ